MAVKRRRKAKRETLKKTMNHFYKLPLHKQYVKRTRKANIDKEKTEQLPGSTSLKNKTEGFILATKKQHLVTQNYQTHLLRN